MKFHDEPITDRLAEIIQEMRQLGDGKNDLVFFAGRDKRGNEKMFSDAAMRNCLLMLDKTYTDEHDQVVVPHGFRSCVRDTCSEVWNDFQNEAAVDACRAHAVSDKTQAAYLRAKHFQLRTTIMQTWTDFVVSGKRG